MSRFKNELTEDIAKGHKLKGISPDIVRKAMMKITMVMAASDLKDLRVPPSNHLEKLQGDRKGQYSVRVNDKYRICFEWNDNRASQIEFVDYH
jgi:proteic killer suppression protein